MPGLSVLGRELPGVFLYWKESHSNAKGDLPYAEKTEKIFALIIFERLADAVRNLRKGGGFPIVAIGDATQYEEVVARLGWQPCLYFGFDDCPYCREIPADIGG